MELQSILSNIITDVQDGEFKINISFNRLEKEFDDKNRLLTLYSDIKYQSSEFNWEATLPTVKIPHRDPALGFLLDGVIFSSVGVYSRAPGIVPDIEKRNVASRTVEIPKIDIVNAKNTTLSIGYRRNAVQIIFKRNTREYKVPIGIFLKAISGLPYEIILNHFAFKPQALLNSFPCAIPSSGKDLAKAEIYGLSSSEEPTIDECVNAVFAAITQIRDDNVSNYTTHWKVNRINSYFNNLHFKSKVKNEAVLSLGNRAVGSYLDQDLVFKYFDVVRDEEGNPTDEEIIKEFRLPRGYYITDDDARDIRRFDIHTLRVKLNKTFVLQEESPMLFRAKGYKLVEDIPEVNGVSGQIIDEDLLQALNNTDMHYLEVYTPEGRKVLHRSGEEIEIGDFVTILNYLFTNAYTNNTDATQYEVANRIIINYYKQVKMEVEQVYSDIASAIVGSNELKLLLSALPNLPSRSLIDYLRDAKHKEISQSDITNIMSRAIAESKASALMRESPPAMMPVQKGQYARLDSLHSPESDKVGSVQELTITARLNGETGEIEAPYERVVNGVPTGEIVYITASKENNKYIVPWDCELQEDVVLARYNDDVVPISKLKVDYRDTSPFCDMSVSRMCTPFPEFSQPKRALMATRMNGQAVTILKPERPMVSTGADTEVPDLYYTARKILSLCDVPIKNGQFLEVVDAEWKKNLVSYKCIYDQKVFTFDLPFTPTDKESLYYYNINIKPNNLYELDEVVFYNQSCDIGDYDFWAKVKQGSLPVIKDYTKPALALGTNLFIGFKTYGSVTIDDAIAINQRLVDDNTLSNVQIFKYNYTLKRGESFSESDWCAPLYSHVYAHQPIIKIIRNENSKSGSEKEVMCLQSGVIVFASKDDREKEAEVWVATYHSAQIGDKMAGRYGDKSVIAKIVPDEMMPYDPQTGRSLDVVLSPTGMPSRMNFGRVLEVALGAVMLKQSENADKKKLAVCTPFYPNIKKDIVDLYESENLRPVRLFNPVYGKLTERPVMTGILYMMKLEQMSNIKMFAVGYPVAIDPVFGEPVESINQSKGQAMEEMITWSLIASGSHKILNALFNIYSEDEPGRREYFELLEASRDDDSDPWDESSINSNTNKEANRNALVTQTVMRMFGCDVEVVNNRYVLSPLNMQDIAITLTRSEFNNGYERVKDFEWTKVPLAAPVINPFWVNNFPLQIILGIKSVGTLIRKRAYLDINKIHNRKNCIIPASSVEEDEKIKMLTGIEAVIELLKKTTIDEAIARIREQYKILEAKNSLKGSEDVSENENDNETEVEILDEEFDIDSYTDLGNLGEVPMNVADVLRFLENMKRNNRSLNELIWYEMPIMPRMFRQSSVVGNREQEHSFQQQLRSICSSKSTSQDIYEGLKSLIGYGTAKKNDLVSIRGYFFGRNSQAGKHGKVRGSVLSKRVGFSGRVVIVPMEEADISPFFIGLPWHVVCTELGKVLSIRLKKRENKIASHLRLNIGFNASAVLGLTTDEWQAIIESLGFYNPYVLRKYFVNASETELNYIFNYIRSVVKEIFEGKVSDDGLIWYKGKWTDPVDLPDDATIDCAVIMTGRQPTLHKKSIRVFFGKLVDGYCMRIHPVVCGAYNADFDGDTMWNVQLFGECKNEALKTISIIQDLVSEKDGSYTLTISQDVALGIYCATTFKDNFMQWEGSKGQYYYFDNLDELRMQLEYGDVHYYDAVLFYNEGNDCYYCSTAGRILLNGQLSGGFTRVPFSDTDGIGAKVLDEDVLSLCKELRYDCAWTATAIKPDGFGRIVKIENILLDSYNNDGARKSIMVTQALYEIGLAASDVYSVSMSLEDLSTNVDKDIYMQEPRERVAKLNQLYQYGLISEDNRKLLSVSAWDEAKKRAQEDIIKSLDLSSNIAYMMYSGARGKPDQIMQTIGFIGNISKTTQTDIEYPILRGYGEGLTSLELFQTRYTARIGVISTNAGTKETGYATRQSVYMTSGFDIEGNDCGITWRSINVEYGNNTTNIQYLDGTLGKLSDLKGEFVSDNTESFDILSTTLNKSGYMITDEVLDLIREYGISYITLIGEHNKESVVQVLTGLDPGWKQYVIDELYSYALPYTVDMKITKKTMDWVEQNRLQKIIAFEKYDYDNKLYFDKEAYLPVDYDTSSYKLYLDGESVDEEALMSLQVDEYSEGSWYYINLLTEDNLLTSQAIKYLTKKKIRSINFVNGSKATIIYTLSDLFKSVIEGRVSTGLLHLDGDNCITKDTINYIEEYQLDYIPIRTGMTCFAEGGICKTCYGKSLSSKKMLKDKDNLGIAASQAMCEPLSQATLNVGHSGGKRSAGTAMVSGLSYYQKMLSGSLITERTASLLEKFSPHSGYVQQNKHNKNLITILDDDNVVHTLLVDDADRLNVADGAYIDKGDTLLSGYTDLTRYDSTDVFDAALKTRYMLLKEYHRVFSSLNVSARNTEILARAQTSICYFVGKGAKPKTKDTSEEARYHTGDYKLTVSNQAQVVNKFSSIASYGFENVANMLLMGLLNTEGWEQNSCLGNLIVGSPVGSSEARFIPKEGIQGGTKYRKSSVQERKEYIDIGERVDDGTLLTLGQGGYGIPYSLEDEEELFGRLLGESSFDSSTVKGENLIEESYQESHEDSYEEQFEVEVLSAEDTDEDNLIFDVEVISSEEEEFEREKDKRTYDKADDLRKMDFGVNNK